MHSSPLHSPLRGQPHFQLPILLAARLPAPLFALLLVAGCDILPTSPARPHEARLVSGNDQTAAAGAQLILPLMIEVLDKGERPVRGVEVSWSVSEGWGTLQPLAARTDVDGRAEARWTLGPQPGENRGAARVAGLPGVELRAVARETPGFVTAVYLVPSDRPVRPQYLEAIEEGMAHLRAWYRKAMGNGTTFRLSDPPVTVLQSPEPVTWFQSWP